MRLVIYTGEPCFFCESRGSCRHRQVEDAPIIREEPDPYDAHDRGQGKNFKRKRHKP